VTRSHHRDHVEGDYKNPPPAGIYEAFAIKNRESLKCDEVSLDWSQREAVGKALKSKLDELGVILIAIAASGQHVHLLLKARPKEVRNQVGKAKMHTWFELRKGGWKRKLWGRRGKFLRVRDRAHQLNVFRYILRHAEQGAWVWYYTPARDESALE
jgi:REP element-mobilizing transposase RayT